MSDPKTEPLVSMSGFKTAPLPSTTSDCRAAKDMARTKCSTKNQLVHLADLVEVYKTGAGTKWKQGVLTARKQFINLDEKVDASTDHPEFGRPVWLKARLQWISGDKTRSLAGKEVYWYIEASKTNNKKLSIDQKGSFDSQGSGKEKKVSQTDKDGWTDPVPFYLSLYGGDKFSIYATSDKGYKAGKKAGPYTVWRKFWFQVSEMAQRSGKGRYTLPKAVTDAIGSGYKKAKIEFTEKGPRGKIPHKGSLLLSEMDTLGKTHFVSDNRVPFKCHLMTCDYAGVTSKSVPIKDKLKTSQWTYGKDLFLWPHDGDRSWKVEAKYKSGKSWKDIPEEYIKTSPSGGSLGPGWKKVQIDFSGKGSPAAPTAKAPVDIKLNLKVAKDYYLGWGGGRAHILLCTGMLRDFFNTGHDAVQRSDAVHEIGHALGLVNMAPTKSGAHTAWEEKDPNHKRHCAQKGNKCAMFWASSTTRITTFHSIGGQGCNEHLRTQDFQRSVMKPLWK